MARGEQPTWSDAVVRRLSIFPIIHVPNALTFTVKIVALVGGFQCAGAAYYRWKTLGSD